MRRFAFTSALALSCCLFSITALASSFQNGDIFVSTGSSVLRYNQSGTLLQTIAGSGFGLAFDPSGNVYVAGGSSVQKFDTSGNSLGTFVSSFPGTLGSATDIDFDSAGNAYVVGIQDGSHDFISKYSSTGTLLGSVSIIQGQENWVYVDAAGNTILVTPGTASVIEKFDAATLGSTGSVLNSGGNPNGDVEGLAGGGLIVISSNPINQYNSSGTLTGTYNTVIPTSGTWIGLDSFSSTNFWAVTDFGEVYDFNLGTSTPVSGFNTASTARAIAVYTGSSGVPEPSTVALLGAGLGLLAWMARRRKAY